MFKITVKDTRGGETDTFTTDCFFGVCSENEGVNSKIYIDCKGDVLAKTFLSIDCVKKRALSQLEGLSEVVEIQQLMSEIDELLKPDEEQKEQVDDVPVVKL